MEQQLQLLALVQRTMALPLGRGMFLYSTARPMLTVPLAIPPLCMTGKLSHTRTSVALDAQTYVPVRPMQSPTPFLLVVFGEL